MSDIGSLMTATKIISEKVDNPVGLLRAEINAMKNGLKWYEKNYPNTDTTKKSELINRLNSICESLEACEPISVMRTISSKLSEAAKHKFRPDCACVWIPLTPNVPDIHYAKPAIIDLVGWNILTQYDYNHVGMCNGTFITSNTDDGGYRL